MRKLFLSLVAAIVAVTASYAQSSLTATLNHQGTLTVFNGSNAFVEAMTAAEHGDVISLSAGIFAPIDITKAVTIRGVGVEGKSTTIQRTSSNYLHINISDYGNNKLTIEGVIWTCELAADAIELPDILINKSIMGSITCLQGSSIHNLTIIHSKTGNLSFMLNKYSDYIAKVRIINSVVGRVSSSGVINGYNQDVSYINCVLATETVDEYATYIQFDNCIFYCTGTNTGYHRKLNGTNSVNNCIGSDTHVFDKLSDNSTNVVMEPSELNALFEDTEWYHLTDEAAAQYLGNDGTCVGVDGGNLPLDLTIPVPQITRLNVARKTTTDGKLSVDIEVNAAE